MTKTDALPGAATSSAEDAARCATGSRLRDRRGSPAADLGAPRTSAGASSSRLEAVHRELGQHAWLRVDEHDVAAGCGEVAVDAVERLQDGDVAAALVLEAAQPK